MTDDEKTELSTLDESDKKTYLELADLLERQNRVIAAMMLEDDDTYDLRGPEFVRITIKEVMNGLVMGKPVESKDLEMFKSVIDAGEAHVSKNKE